MEQNYEFSYPKEDMCTCISGMPNGNYFVGGFESGTFRVFDIEKLKKIIFPIFLKIILSYKDMHCRRMQISRRSNKIYSV